MLNKKIAWAFPLVLLWGLSIFIGAQEAEKKLETSIDPMWAQQAEKELYFNFGASLGFNYVSGDQGSFRSFYQMTDKAVGGLHPLFARFLGANYQITTTARAIHETDYGFQFDLKVPAQGYFRAWLDNSPRYFDSTYIAYNWAPFQQSTTQDLKMDTTRFGIEVGLRYPEMPYLTFGFEHTKRRGETDLFWGGQTIPDTTTTPDPDISGAKLPADLTHAYVAPLFRNLDTEENRIYLRATHEIGPVDVKVILEWKNKYGSEDYDEPWYLYPVSKNDRTATSIWQYDPNFSGLSTGLNIGVDIIESTLRFDSGYTYLRTSNKSDLTLSSFTPAGAVYYGNHALILLPGTKTHNTADTHRFNIRGEWTPHQGVTAWGLVEYSMSDSKNRGARQEEGTEGVKGGIDPFLADEVWLFDTKNEEKKWREEVGVRLNVIPRTTITATGEFENSDIEYDWTADFQDGPDTGTVPDQGNWRWKADGDVDMLGASFRLSYAANSWFTLDPYYRYRLRDYDVAESIRLIENKTGDPEYTVTNTAKHYPGQLKTLTTITHTPGFRAQIKLADLVTLRPHYEFQYLVQRNDKELYEDVGKRKTHEYGLGLSFYPIEDLVASLDTTWQESETLTPARKYTNSFLTNPLTGVFSKGWRGGLIQPVDNTYWTISGAVQYTWEEWSFGLLAGFSHLKSNWDTDIVWTGANIHKKLTKRASISGSYQFTSYDERGNDGWNEFQAHSFRAGFEMKF